MGVIVVPWNNSRKISRYGSLQNSHLLTNIVHVFTCDGNIFFFIAHLRYFGALVADAYVFHRMPSRKEVDTIDRRKCDRKCARINAASLNMSIAIGEIVDLFSLFFILTNLISPTFLLTQTQVRSFSFHHVYVHFSTFRKMHVECGVCPAIRWSQAEIRETSWNSPATSVSHNCYLKTARNDLTSAFPVIWKLSRQVVLMSNSSIFLLTAPFPFPGRGSCSILLRSTIN